MLDFSDKDIINMKTNTKRFVSALLAVILCFGCFISGISVSAEETDTAEINFDFAVKTAEIIKNNDDSMLRIIGKLRSGISGFDFPHASDCVISEDGRFVLQFSSEKELTACLEFLQNNPAIIYAEQDMPVYTESFEKSAYLSWGVKAIEADVYSKSIKSGNSVTVAIVDSGSEDIDFLKDKLVQGYDFFGNDSDAFQDTSKDSHGTFLASVVADCVGNLPVRIMPVRVLDSESASLINVINGIIYAVDNGADVINLSLCAILTNCKSLEDAVNYANNNGVTVVVCAGNSKSDVQNFCPSHSENVLTVSAVNSNYAFSQSFSNFGEDVDLAAPGENIIGYNANGELSVLSGTSMSAAFISAAASMYIFDNPGCKVENVKSALTSCAKDLGDEGKDDYYGWGIPKLSGLIKESTVISVESIAFAQDSYSLSVGDSIEITPVFYPADATDKSFTVSADNGNVFVNENIVTAVSSGKTVITITSNDGAYTDTAIINISETEPEISASLKIRNNNGNKTINYGETLRLTAEITNQPANTAVWWYVDGIKKGEGLVFEVSPVSGSVEVTAKLVDSNGNAVKNKNNSDISDSQKVSVNSGFFRIVISFFKNLFGMNRTVIQTLMK